MNKAITLSMIVKNEAGSLRACLDSVTCQVDEIVVVDTGSTDGTLSIAREYTDLVYNYPWDNDFSAARNFAMKKARGEWILYLDADEELVAENGALKRLIASNKHLEAYLLPLEYPTGTSAGEYNRFMVLRLFKNNGRYLFQGNIHEQVAITGQGVVGLAEAPVIRHKLLPAGERNRKRGRNLALLQKSCSTDPNNCFLQYYIGVEWLGLGKPDRALPCFRHAYHNLTDDNLLFRSPALRYLLICLISLGRLEEAYSLCREAEPRYSDYTDIYYLAGIILEEKKEYYPAIDWFKQAAQRGTPPPLYSHMNGTGSFLAYYHLGYSYEKLGQRETAKNYLEKSLEANQKYFYPVHSLFQILMAEGGPRHTLAYLKEKGYMDNVGVSLAVANLFFIVGYPGLARRCLENLPAKSESCHFHLGVYNIYSGMLQQGLSHLKRIAEESSYYIQSLIHQSIAQMLMGCFDESKAMAIKLWKNNLSRGNTRLLLRLTRLMKNGTMSCPQKGTDAEMLKAAREILEYCGNYLPEEISDQKCTPSRLINSLEFLLKENTDRGFLELLEFYRDKSGEAREFFEYKFMPGGRRG